MLKVKVSELKVKVCLELHIRIRFDLKLVFFLVPVLNVKMSVFDLQNLCLDAHSFFGLDHTLWMTYFSSKGTGIGNFES